MKEQGFFRKYHQKHRYSLDPGGKKATLAATIFLILFVSISGAAPN
jgi:hypothetical protein